MAMNAQGEVRAEMKIEVPFAFFEGETIEVAELV